MKNFAIKAGINILSLLFVVYIIRSIHSESFIGVVLFGIIITIINIYIKPILLILTIPFNIASLGFLTLLINGLFFYLTGRLIEGFYIAGFWSAFWGALLFSIVSIILNMILASENRIRVVSVNRRSSTNSLEDNTEIIDIDAEEEVEEEEKEAADE